MTREELVSIGISWMYRPSKGGARYLVYKDGELIANVSYRNLNCGSIEEYISREIKWGHIKVGE